MTSRTDRSWWRSRAVALAVAVVSTFLLFMEITPPGSAPDESSHLLRVGALAAGHPLGTQPDAATFTFPPLTPPQVRRVRLESGAVGVERDFLYLTGGDCNAFYPALPACAAPRPVPRTNEQPVSYHARAQIAAYLLPSVLSFLGWSARSTFYFSRLGVVLACAALVLLGLWRVSRAKPGAGVMVVVAGVAAAYTPLAAFLSGVLAPSAVGVAGAVAVLLATWSLGVTDAVTRADRVVWFVALFAACASQSVGYLFAFMAVLFGVLAVPTSVRRFASRLGRPSAIVAAIIAAWAVGWDFLFKARDRSMFSRPSFEAIVNYVADIWRATLRADTGLGWVDTTMPTIVTAVCVGLFCWFVLGSLILGDRRWAFSVGGMAVIYVAVTLWFARSYEGSGFLLQSRFFLPGVVLFPVAAALRVYSLGNNVWRALRPRAVLVLWAGSAIVALYTLARRHVVGTNGPIWFFGHGEYRPLGGWLLVGLTALLFVGSVVVGLLPDRHVVSTTDVGSEVEDTALTT